MKPVNITIQICLIGLVIAGSVQTMAATRFSVDRQPLGSLAPLVLSSTDLSTDNVTAYRNWFENGSWQGDIVEYSVSGASLTTSVDLSGTSPTNPGVDPANWSALATMQAAEDAAKLAGSDHWDSGREIITNVGNVQKPFRWDDADGIGAANMALLDQTAVDDSAASSDILDFIRGDRSNEFPDATALRGRISVIGDIIHSNALYVTAPNDNRTDNGYAVWAAAKSAREHRIYVGANDGMLHVFDAADGSEVYAYIPSMLMGRLQNLLARPYVHSYFVDGKLTTRDVYYDDDWHTVLVGSLGAGGKGLFALDISNPDLDDETATSGTDIKVLWEINAAADDDLGDSFSRAIIAQLNDGKWYAVTGNGYNSINGVAILYITNIETGVVKKISTASGTVDSPNGLSTPGLLDSNKDGKVDYAYAGDIDGNLWKFDLSSATPADWALVAGPLHPYQTIGAQAITIAPLIGLHPYGGHIIYFATGRLFNIDDINDVTVQAMYGIWDKPGATPPTKDTQSLLAQTWTDKTFDCCDGDATISEEVAVYNPNLSIDWASKHGWKVEFPAGYRTLEALQIRGSRAKVTIHSPLLDKNYIIEAALTDGGSHASPIYDLSADGLLSTTTDADAVPPFFADLVDGNDDSDLGDVEDIPMAWQMFDGLMSQVTIARLDNGLDTMFLNYLVLLNEPCEIDCTDGFQGGHIDVDTYHDGKALGGGSTEHTHEYDKKVERVYVDFFDLVETGHIEINKADSGIASDEKFIVLLANADFSPGSTLSIGAKSWNVVEYQRQLHKALKNWDASLAGSAPLDSDGDSLIFTWAEIAAVNGGTGSIRHAFNDMSIMAGGLHPTQTGCVKDGAYETYDNVTKIGRWRNGALTTQLIKASYFSSASAINDVDVQLPEDLVELVYLTNKVLPVSLTEDFDDDGTIETSNHERIGGLIARSGTEHIWESTLFWHFDSDPCYGEAGWDFAVIEQSINPLAAALEFYGIEGTLAEELAAHEVCKDIKDDEIKDGVAGCKTYYGILEDLLKLEGSSLVVPPYFVYTSDFHPQIHIQAVQLNQH